MIRQTIFFFFFFWSLAGTAVAAEIYFDSPRTPYEVIAVGSDPEIKRAYFGELKDSPVMYELVSTEDFQLSAQVAQPVASGDPAALTVIIVRALQNGRVVLVSRITTKPEEWQKDDDRMVGMSWFLGNNYSERLPPGTYRVEVSAPTNMSLYRLELGQKEETIGYFATWKQITSIHSFFDNSLAWLLRSWFFLAHIAVIVLAYVIYRLWRKGWFLRTARQSRSVTNTLKE